MNLTDKYFARGRAFLNVDYPIICGAITRVSDPQLVATVANVGGFALLASGNTPVDILEQQIDETRRLTDKPFGINLITIAPLYQEHLKLVLKKNIPLVVFAGSFPRKKEVVAIKQGGAKVLCVASTMSIANRMLDYGAEGLLLEGIDKIDKGKLTGAEAQMKVEEFWVGRLRDAAVDGDIKNGSVMAGQSVGLIDKIQPVKDIIQELVTNMETELQRVKRNLHEVSVRLFMNLPSCHAFNTYLGCRTGMP